MKLSAENLCLEYKDGSAVRKILHNINLDISSGECIALTGASGSGKSSLIYLLSTLRKPTSGKVRLNDLDIVTAKNTEQIRFDNFGFVFQQHFLIPHLSVFENICGSKPASSGISSEIQELFEILGISDLTKRMPHQLSGGERQRVAIARALAKNPAVVFADEPTASLDAENAAIVYSLLRKASLGKILVIATHDTSLFDGTERVVNLGRNSFTA